MKPVRESLGVEVVAGLVLDEPVFVPSLHWHPEWELTLILEGAGARHVGDHVETFGPGEAVLVAPNVPHCWNVPATQQARVRAAVVHFGPAMTALIQALPAHTPTRGLLERGRRGLLYPEVGSSVVTRIVSAAHTSDDARAAASTLDLLASLADCDASPLSCQAGIRVNRGIQRRIDEVCRHVLAHHDRPVGLAEVAAVACMSAPAFSRFFRKTMGLTFTEYLTQVRVATACALLRDTDWTIATVATRAGFANLSNFNRQFRRLKAMPPRDYRRFIHAATLPKPTV